jgi:hypothetical protein
MGYVFVSPHLRSPESSLNHRFYPAGWMVAPRDPNISDLRP